MVSAGPIDTPMFQARALVPAMARRAFVLVRLSKPAIDLRRWEAFVRDCMRTPRGMAGHVALEDARGYIHGLFHWRLLRDLTHGLSLDVSDVMLAGWPGTWLPIAAMSAVRALADLKRADAIILRLGDSPRGLTLDLLASAGFKPSGMLFECIGTPSSVREVRKII